MTDFGSYRGLLLQGFQEAERFLEYEIAKGTI
jgi:hypothetical protein